MSYSGEQTLLVTRPTRLIALRWWSAVVLALIVAGGPLLQLPWRVCPPPPDPGPGPPFVGAVPRALFLLLPPLPLPSVPPAAPTHAGRYTAHKNNRVAGGADH